MSRRADQVLTFDRREPLDTPSGRGRSVSVTPCPAGPLIVRGADSVRDDDGVEHPVTRPVVAVCVCGKSARQPWCDSTHKAIPDFGSGS
jgi:CDGSH-type Zn-finger protein